MNAVAAPDAVGRNKRSLVFQRQPSGGGPDLAVGIHDVLAFRIAGRIPAVLLEPITADLGSPLEDRPVVGLTVHGVLHAVPYRDSYAREFSSGQKRASALQSR